MTTSLTTNLFNQVQHAWNYATPSLFLTFNLLDMAVMNKKLMSSVHPDTPTKINSLVTHIKWSWAVGIFFGLSGIKDSVETIFKNYQSNNAEEGAFNLLSMGIQVLDTADSALTFLNGALPTFGKEVPKEISNLGIPNVICLLSMVIASTLASTAKTALLYWNLYQVESSKDEVISAELTTFLEDKIAPINPDFVEAKRLSLKRSASKESIVSLERLSKLSSNPTTIRQKISVIRGQLVARMALKVVDIVSATLTITGLKLFSSKYSAYVPLTLLATSSAIRIAVQSYEDLAKSDSV